MQNNQRNQIPGNSLQGLATTELRRYWSESWSIQPHRYIRREMLEKSLLFKLREQAGLGLTPEQQERLNKLVQAYKRNPHCFDETRAALKPGTRLVRLWDGKKHCVLVLQTGFEYESRKYNSLSEIAFVITGTRWNGWVFFGLKKKKEGAA